MKLEFNRSNKLNRVGFSLFFFVATFLARPLFAGNEGFNIDGLIGIDLISGGANVSSSTSSLGFGGRLGYHLNPTWEMGFGVTTTSNSVNVGNLVSSSSTTLLMADLNYHLPNEWDPLYLGMRLGMGINTGSTNGTTVNQPTASNFAYGLVGGYDFKVNQNFTIGPRIAYTMVTQSPGNLSGESQCLKRISYDYYTTKGRQHVQARFDDVFFRLTCVCTSFCDNECRWISHHQFFK